MKNGMSRKIRIISDRTLYKERSLDTDILPDDDCYHIMEDDKSLGTIFTSTGNIYVDDSELANVIKQRLEQMKQRGIPFKFKVRHLGNGKINFEIRSVDKRKKRSSIWRRLLGVKGATEVR